MKLRYLIAIVIAGILIGVSAYHYLTRLGKGDLAPNFALSDIAGEQHTLEEYRGSVVALHFWATWCDVCRIENPQLESVYRAFEKRGFKVVSILEDEDDPEAKLQAYLMRSKLTFPILLDPVGKVAKQYQSYGVPETFFIDREGKIVKRITGAIDWNGRTNLDFLKAHLHQ